MSNLKSLLDNNKQWASTVTANDPDFFKNLSQQQTPEYLWIGCSDSRVPVSKILNLAPGEVFVHRNIANMVIHTDLSCLSVLQFAVENLKVKHIIICGHYGCGGVQAAIHKSVHGHETKQIGLVDNWLGHIEDVQRLHKNKLANLDSEQQLKSLCELNVLEQVRNVCNTAIVNKAWNNGVDLTVHGWIYDLSNGLIVDLKSNIKSSFDIQNTLDDVK